MLEEVTAILIRSSGETRGIRPLNGTDFTLKELQGYVGGSIQMIWVNENMCMILNDEGKLLKFAPNIVATELASGVLYPGDFICGNAILAHTNLVK